MKEKTNNYENGELPPFDSQHLYIGMDTSEDDSSCSIDIIEEHDREQMELAKNDLNKIFSKINKSLRDLGDPDNNGAKSKDSNSKTERTEVSFQINMTHPSTSDHELGQEQR